MSSRENLIPTPTVDRNGKATTVYRRGNAPAHAMRPLPAPVALSSDSREKLILELGDKMTSGNFIAKEIKLAVRRNLYSYSDELLHTIQTAIRTDIAEGKGMNGVDEKIRSKIRDGDREESINEAIFFYPLLKHRGISLTANVINALHHFPQLQASADYSREDPETVAQCIALIRVIDKLSSLQGALDINWAIKDQRLTELVLANPERGEQIAALIKDRKTGDTELIKEMLSSETPVMSDGIL